MGTSTVFDPIYLSYYSRKNFAICLYFWQPLHYYENELLNKNGSHEICKIHIFVPIYISTGAYWATCNQRAKQTNLYTVTINLVDINSFTPSFLYHNYFGSLF